MNHAKPFVPKAITQADQGVRRSIRRLFDLIDTEDPALPYIAAAIQRRHDTGALVDAAGVIEATQEGRAAHLRAQEAKDLPAYPESIVYYIRRAHLIKIGTTRRPRPRFWELLPDEILAWEPGDRFTESSRHRQFACCRIRGSELFHQTDELLDHISATRDEHGRPNPEWPTTQTIESLAGLLITPEAPVSPELVTVAKGAEILDLRVGTINVWVHRGKIKAQAVDWQGKPLYRLDDLRSVSSRGRARTKAAS